MGIVESWHEGLLTIRRTFTARGRYDTLGERMLAGDYGTIEVVDRGWVLRRTYFRADGRIVGELFNIQTPAVARFADGRVQIVDEEDLATVVRAGAVPLELAERALDIARRLAGVLRAGGDWRTVT